MAPLKSEMSSAADEQDVPSIHTTKEDQEVISVNADETDATQQQQQQQRGMSMQRNPDNKLRRRVRSRSAPPPAGFNRKNNTCRRLVDQHFKIDRENRALLPGVPAHDEDLARDIHDFFNLIVLVPIVVLNVLNWDWDSLFYGNNKTDTKNIPFIHAWTGEYFHLFFWTTVAYFVIDLIWVCVIPKCVKSPSTIVQHHIAVFLYLIIPYKFSHFRFLMGVCMSVELNTWFLIARRVFNKQGMPPWKFDIPYLLSVRVKLISICFYITWISIRCIMYPFVLYVLMFPMSSSKKYGQSTDGSKHALWIAIVLQATFCILNGQWSLQLLNSKIKQWKTKGRTKISSGL